MEAPFTLRGLVTELAAARGVVVDYRTVWNFVHAQGFSFKKKACCPASRIALTSRHRARWQARQASIDPGRLVFIDGTWPRPTWRRCEAGHHAGVGSRRASPTAIGRR